MTGQSMDEPAQGRRRLVGDGREGKIDVTLNVVK
jgi:hypothetical protein